MKKVVILGASGHGHVIADIITACGDYVEAFLDDDTSIAGVAGPIADYRKFNDCEFIIGIGNQEVRKSISQLNCRWYTAIHPTAVISPQAKIGEGTVAMANAVINARAKVGKHCIINTGAIVEHDNIINDYAHISVGAKLAGTVSVGKGTLVGIGACVVNNHSICDGALIGAGAVVVTDIKEPGTYIGIPARRIVK